jgi:hypothetical protein
MNIFLSRLGRRKLLITFLAFAYPFLMLAHLPLKVRAATSKHVLCRRSSNLWHFYNLIISPVASARVITFLCRNAACLNIPLDPFANKNAFLGAAHSIKSAPPAA